jgi:phage tail sheath protein FI
MVDWIKTNLIIILAVALGATFLFGSLGTLYYRNKAEIATLRAEKAEAQLQTCATVNKSLSDSVGRQNTAVDQLLGAAAVLEAAAKRAAAAAALAAQPSKDLAVALRAFKPPANTAAEPCKAERAVIDEFLSKRRAAK